MEYLISIFLIVLSALFSGLTLGLLSLNVHELKRQADLGNKDAAAIYPVRKKGNMLLSTLLLGNVLVNAILAIFLGTIASGVVAGIIATAAIFIFGEILPQAVISRHALVFGAKTIWLVRFFVLVLSPVTVPLAWVLDKLLGEELAKVYSKKELMQIISEHEDSEDSPIDRDEERIVHGALMFSHTKVEEAMTKLKDVVMFSDNQLLDKNLREEIFEQGHSRYPVYKDKRERVIGILYAKDVLGEDEDVPVAKAGEAFSREFLVTKPKETLDHLLTKMLKARKHMAIVRLDGSCVGVITMEDILEEIIQHEIEDESDD